jgi:hypothetical protein
MSLQELTEDQLDQLRQTYICIHVDNPSYEDLADTDSVTDEMLEEEFGGIDFVEEDFF